MRHHAIGKVWVIRATLLGLLIALAISVFALGGCTSAGPTPTPTRTLAIVVVTLTPVPPTPASPTAVPPTAPPTLAITIEQPTMAPPTPAQQQTVEPYPVDLTPTLTPESYPPPSS